MTAVLNNNNKIQVESVRGRAAAGESAMQAIGGAINQLFDDRDTTNANLAAEIVDRIAADAVLQGEIDTINSRLTSARNISQVYNASVAVQGNLGFAITTGMYDNGTVGQVYSVIRDAGRFKVVRNRLSAPTTIVKDLIWDPNTSGTQETTNRFFELTWNSTGAQMFIELKVWEISAV